MGDDQEEDLLSTHGTPCQVDPIVRDEQLLAKFKLLLQQELAAAVSQLSASFASDIRDLGDRTNTLEERVDEIVTVLESSESAAGAVRDEVTLLQQKLEDLENRSRRENVRIRGLPEFMEDIPSTVTALLQELLPSIPVDRLELDRAHRALGPRRPGLDILKSHELYSAPPEADGADLERFFEHVELPSIAPDCIALLDSPVMPQEILAAIKSTKTSKTPGLDGFGGLYYKKFAPLLVPHLANLFNAMCAESSLGPSSLLADICMIPKPDKDSLSIPNYRPISLINTDVKLLAKVLATRPNTFLESLIHRDQVGFVPSRQAGDNVRRVAHLVQHAWARVIPAFPLSLNLQKAFDTISWDYLLWVLRRWGFGQRFLDWIKSLYEEPMARDKDVEDRLNNLLIKYRILEDEPMKPRSLSERMMAVQYRLISAYAQKNKLPVEAFQNVDNMLCSEDLSLTEHVKLLTALMEVTLTDTIAEGNTMLSSHTYMNEKIFFLFCILNKLYKESRTTTGNVFRRIMQEFSDTNKDQLTLILFNGIWDLVKALTFYLEACNTGASQEKIATILHQVQTYRLALEISVAALQQNEPLNFLMQETEKENDKDITTIIEEMRKLGHSGVVVNFLEPVLKKLMNDLPQYVAKHLDTDMKNQAIQMIKKFEPASPNVDNMVKILISLSVAVKDITSISSDDPTKTLSGYFPRATQFASLLTLLLSDSPDGKGCLLEVATGEGKSCIVALFALIQAIRGMTVDVITSSPVLAHRDAEEWCELYKKFGISCSVIPPPSLNTFSDSQDIDAAICKAYTSHIVYGTIEDFSADILRQEFEKKNTRDKRKFDIAIVDEVDYMTLDNGIQITFLSHDATGMRHLDQLLTAIWAKLHNCQRIMEESGNIFWATGIQHFLKLVIGAIVGKETEHFNSIHILESGVKLGLISEEDLQEARMQTSSEGSDLQSTGLEKVIKKFGPQQQKYLLEAFGEVLQDAVQFRFYELQNNKASFIGNSCDTGEPLCILLLPEGLACFLMTEKELVNITVKELSDIIKYSDECSSEGQTNKKDESFIILPKHLKKYTQDRLPVFVENALLAILMQKGREYAIDSRDRSDSPESHSIIPIDFKSTGVLEKNKCWGDGLQQFLELKHKLALSQLSSVTNFMSNFHFFQRYIAGSGVYGVSGTLGDEVDFTFLKKHFKTSCYPMPTHRYTKKLELPVLQISGGREAWILEICTLVKKRTSPRCGTEGQCVLVVCEDVKTSEELQLKLIELNAISDPAKITLYTRSDKHNVETKIFQPGEVILATNLGGRGTDIKVTQAVNKSGGLSVILTHFPANRRVEKQIFGRTSRKGNPGVVQMVLNQQDLPPAYQGQTVEEMRKLRENYETKRIADMENDELVEVSTRQELFTLFCDQLKTFDSHYTNEERQDFHRRRDTLSKDCLKKSGSDKMDYHPALNSMKETWALWLTTHEKDIHEHKDIKPLKDDLNNTLNQKSTLLLEGKSENFYDFIKAAVDRTHLHIGDKSNDYGALFYWEKMEETDKIYRAISLYNRALITINMGKDGYKTKAINFLKEAKPALEIYTSEICNVITFGDVAQSSRFQPHNKETNFSLQTQMKLQLLNSWNNHIDNAITKLEELEKNKGAITKEASVFTLTMNRSKVEADEVSLLYDYGLSLFFEVEQKPKFCFDALICFILGGLQILAGALVCVLTIGIASQFGLGLIAEGVSDVISGIIGMVSGTFSWVQWAISKAISIAISLVTAGFSVLTKATKTIFNVTKDLVKGTQTFSSVVRGMALKHGTKAVAKKAMMQVTKAIGKELLLQGMETASVSIIDTAANATLKKIFVSALSEKIHNTLHDNKELENVLTSFIVTQAVPVSALQKEQPEDYAISPRNKKLVTDSIESLVSSAMEEVSSNHETYNKVISGLNQATDFLTAILDNKIKSSKLNAIKLSVCIAEYAIQFASIVTSLQIDTIINKEIIPHIISGMTEDNILNDHQCKFKDVLKLKDEMQLLIDENVTKGMADLLAEQVVGCLRTTWQIPCVKNKVIKAARKVKIWQEKKSFQFNQEVYLGKDPFHPVSPAQVKDLIEDSRSCSSRVSKNSFQTIDLELNALSKSELLEGQGVKVTLVKEDGTEVSTEYYATDNPSAEPIELLMKKSEETGQLYFHALSSVDRKSKNRLARLYDAMKEKVIGKDHMQEPVDPSGWVGLYAALSQAIEGRITGDDIQASIDKEIELNKELYLPQIIRELQRQEWNDLAAHYQIPGLDYQQISDGQHNTDWTQSMPSAPILIEA
ncbi:uncharacterized protein PAF06_009885 [Gastrophryne carolinensis]